MNIPIRENPMNAETNPVLDRILLGLVLLALAEWVRIGGLLWAGWIK